MNQPVPSGTAPQTPRGGPIEIPFGKRLMIAIYMNYEMEHRGEPLGPSIMVRLPGPPEKDILCFNAYRDGSHVVIRNQSGESEEVEISGKAGVLPLDLVLGYFEDPDAFCDLIEQAGYDDVADALASHEIVDIPNAIRAALREEERRVLRPKT